MIKIEENVVPLRTKNATYTQPLCTLIIWKKKRTIRISYSGRETGTG